MTQRLKCLPLTGVSDGPYFSEPLGTLTALQNMRLRPGSEKGAFYAEAFGGMERLKPSGGTPAEPVVVGGTPAGIQVSSSNGWIRTFAVAGSVWSGNLQFSEGNYLPFAAGSVNDAYYFGADAPFGRIGVGFQQVSTSTLTFVYEYPTAADWSTVGTLVTQETIDWTHALNYTSAIHSYASWQVPSDWVLSVRGDATNGNVLKYWMRIRISVSTAVVALPTIGLAFGSWVGVRELFLMSQRPYSAGANGQLLRCEQSAAGVQQYFQINGSGLYSSPEAIPSMAGYRGRVFFTEPKETMRYDGRVLQNVGNAAPVGTLSSHRSAGTGIGAGIWRHYLAWGYGPLQNYIPSVGNVGYMAPMYGVSQATLVVPTANADPLDANSLVTTVGNETCTIDWSGLTTTPADASCLIIYRTKNLANVNPADRAGFPAEPVFCMPRIYFLANTSAGESFNPIDGGPPAVLYDNRPPKGARFCFVLENRLLLGGVPGGGWYWSDPFFLDQYNNTFQFFQFVRANGGRDMGGVEFAGWGVFYTEDQTWGAQNLDQDVPYVIPINPGAGNIAPRALAVGDGKLLSVGKDGVYMWDGGKQGPVNVSGKFKHVFANMSYEAHGGSTGTIHNHRYDLTLIDAKNGTIGGAYTLDLQTMEWSTRTTNDKKVPLCLIHAPLGHADAGVPHALYAKATVGTSSASDATSYSPCIAEYTTQNDGTDIPLSATHLFPLAPGDMFSPNRAIAYYQGGAGLGTPALSWSGTPTGSGDVGTVQTNTPSTGGDYSLVTGGVSLQSTGSSDLKLTWAATLTVGGTVGAQRLFGAVLEGEAAGVRQGQ